MSNKIAPLSIPVDDIPRVLLAFYGSGRMPYFRGQPGCGKTALVHEGAAQIADQLKAMKADAPDMAVYELHLASMSEVDIRGYLIPDSTGGAKFTRPVFADFFEKHPRGILFLDEFPQASHEVQKAVAPLMLDGVIGEYKLPASVMVVAAGNREEDGAGVNNMLSHVINRMAIIDVKPPSIDTWCAWGASMNLLPETLIFARTSPGTLMGSPDLSANDEPYCTPRSLHALDTVAQRWTGGLGAMLDSEAGMAVAAGFIGRGAAAELHGVLRLTSKLPTYEEVVANPAKVKIPDQPNEQYAALMMTALRAKLEHSGQVIEYLTRFNPNMAVVGLSALTSRDGQFTNDRRLMQWTIDNRPMLAKLRKYIGGRPSSK